MFGGGLSVTHLIIVLAIVFLLFGNRLPQVMRSLGQGVVEFKKGLQGIEEDVKNSTTSSQTEQLAAKPQSAEPVATAKPVEAEPVQR